MPLRFLLGPGSRSALLDRLPQICDQRSHEVRRAARWPTPSELRGEHVVLVSSQVWMDTDGERALLTSGFQLPLLYIMALAQQP